MLSSLCRLERRQMRCDHWWDGRTWVHSRVVMWFFDVSDLCASHVSRRQCRGHDARWMHPSRDVPRRRPDRKELGILAAKPYLTPSPLQQLAACAKRMYTACAHCLTFTTTSCPTPSKTGRRRKKRAAAPLVPKTPCSLGRCSCMLLDPETVLQYDDSRSSYHGWRHELFLTAAVTARTRYGSRWW